MQEGIQTEHLPRYTRLCDPTIRLYRPVHIAKDFDVILSINFVLEPVCVRMAERNHYVAMSAVVTSDQPPQLMRAFRVERGSSEAILQEIEVPRVGLQDVLIHVRAAILAPDVFRLGRYLTKAAPVSRCKTFADESLLRSVKAGRLQQTPTTLGHKVAGTIAAVGGAVSHLQTGQRVRLDPNLSCGHCLFCRTDRDQMCAECGVMGFFALQHFPRWAKYHCGGLAEYVVAPVTQIDLLPDELSFDVGAMVHDLANAVRALKNAQLAVGSTLLITAATGAMGACCIKAAPFFGVTRLILVARSLERLNESAKLSNIPCTYVATNNLSEGWTTDQGLGKRISELVPYGVDAVIDFSPEGVDLWQVLDSLKVGGTFIPMGGNSSALPYTARTLGLKCWRIIGSRNHSRTDSQSALRLLADGRVIADDLITHEFKLDDVETAARHLQDRLQPSLMTVVRP